MVRQIKQSHIKYQKSNSAHSWEELSIAMDNKRSVHLLSNPYSATMHCKRLPMLNESIAPFLTVQAISSTSDHSACLLQHIGALVSNSSMLNQLKQLYCYKWYSGWI